MFNAFLDGIAVQVADHFPLRLNWLDIFAESRFAVKVKAKELFPGKGK